MAGELELAPDYRATAREETGASQETVGAPKVEDVEEALKDVVDPELGINVVDLGLAYSIVLEGVDVVIDMTLASLTYPLTDAIEEQTTRALEGMTGSIRINWVWLPPWGSERITSDGREMLQAPSFNVQRGISDGALSLTSIRRACPLDVATGHIRGRAPTTYRNSRTFRPRIPS